LLSIGLTRSAMMVGLAYMAGASPALVLGQWQVCLSTVGTGAQVMIVSDIHSWSDCTVDVDRTSSEQIWVFYWSVS